MTRVIRGTGWTLVISGAVVLLYVVYLLWFTGLETNRAQRELAGLFPEVPAGSADAPAEGAGGQDPTITPDMFQPLERDESIEVGDAVAALWFERDGQRIVNDDVLFVVSGVSLDILRIGPGHYPESDVPGGAGNFAVAGHRTTYGSPFWSLNDLQDGDTIHVLDRAGQEWVYGYREQRIVQPTEVWVVGEDPLETGEATITLTTCHPRHSAAQRLIAWGELLTEVDREASPPPGEADDEVQALPAPPLRPVTG